MFIDKLSKFPAFFRTKTLIEICFGSRLLNFYPVILIHFPKKSNNAL